ncbi:MAG: hypothetical protein LIP02_03930 [Bacteroidales bacterium]|nr:hypothetical protein [Bacteroidales bacterium]
MTVSDYIKQKLRAFGVVEADLVDAWLYAGVTVDEDIEELEPIDVAKALISVLAALLLAPRQSNISESGFSQSWDFTKAASYYQWLCKRWGVDADEDLLEAAGLSTVKNASNLW